MQDGPEPPQLAGLHAPGVGLEPRAHEPRLSAIIHNEKIVTGWKRKAMQAVNNCCILYCRIVGLKVIELRKRAA